MKTDIIKTVRQEVIQTVDTETGEVIDVAVNNHKVIVNEDKFALVYVGFWNALLDAQLTGSDIELLCYIIGNYSQGTLFTITKTMRDTVADKTGKSPESYRNSTRALLKNKFIYSADGSRTYKLNPRYAFKGSSNTRKQAVIDMVSKCPDC